MICSEARLAANRLNAIKSCGPKTEEGKAVSRRNGLKHGLTGEGVVVLEGDAEEIERRARALEADMKPRSPAGVILIAQMAMLSVRAERAAEQESAQTSLRVRHAADAFDEERIEHANALFQALVDDPRTNLRKLKKSPEGVDRLIDAWRDLRADLAIEPQPDWTASHLEQAANLTGLKARHALGSRLGALSRGFRGDFAGLAVEDGGDLGDEARRAWAKAMLFERMDAEVAALEAHYETLDFETIELDRAEAGARALFDPSKGAGLARRYESEARRGFFKALKEFRQVEAESEALAEATSAPATAPEGGRTDPRMGSRREQPSPPGREPSRAFEDAPSRESQVLRDLDGQPFRYVPTLKTPD